MQIKLLKRLKWIWYELCRIFCIVMLRILFHMDVEGGENIPRAGAFIIASNHQSFIDPLFCGFAVRKQLNFVGRNTLFKNRYFRWLILSLNATPIKRDEADLTAMKIIISKLREGGSVVLFPEATRTSDGRIADFKPGLELLCKRGNAAVVPVLLDGAFESWPRTEKIFSVGSRIVVRYGRCITADEVRKMKGRDLADKLTVIIRQMQAQARAEQGKKVFDYS